MDLHSSECDDISSLLPGHGNLVFWDRGPSRLSGLLLFKLSIEDLLDVVHVEGTDS